MARYFALRGLHDWAAEEFLKFDETGGALRTQVSALEYGRALWLAGYGEKALVEYKRALANETADAAYLHQCIGAIEAEVASRQRPRSH